MANNSPKDLDLSACTVSIDGGGTPKTISEVAKTVNDINGNIANINAAANEAKKGVSRRTERTNPLEPQFLIKPVSSPIRLQKPMTVSPG